MIPIQPTANNAEQYPYLREMTFTAPEDVPEEDCGNLVALVGADRSYPNESVIAPIIVSFWQPSVEELEILAAGGVIELTMWNNVMCPTAMNVVPR